LPRWFADGRPLKKSKKEAGTPPDRRAGEGGVRPITKEMAVKSGRFRFRADGGRCHNCIEVNRVKKKVKIMVRKRASRGERVKNANFGQKRQAKERRGGKRRANALKILSSYSSKLCARGKERAPKSEGEKRTYLNWSGCIGRKNPGVL